MTRGNTDAHIARATLESIPDQVSISPPLTGQEASEALYRKQDDATIRRPSAARFSAR